eukprot:UN26417
MAGSPWQNAAAALNAGMKTMRQGDRFGIVCFDHEASFFNGTGMLGQPNIPPQFALYNWNEQICHSATTFIQANPPRGGTNIRTPLQWAVETLKMNHEKGRVPFVILCTDGPVRDEREILNFVKASAENVRILTFGIGQHCNWYFLNEQLPCPHTTMVAYEMDEKQKQKMEKESKKKTENKENRTFSWY